MNMDDLQKAIEMLDDDIIFETEKARNGKIKNKKLTIFMKYGSVAACFCILIIGSLIAFSFMNDKKSTPDKGEFLTEPTLNEEIIIPEEDQYNPEINELETIIKGSFDIEDITHRSEDLPDNESSTITMEECVSDIEQEQETDPFVEPVESTTSYDGEKGIFEVITPEKATTKNLSASIDLNSFKTDENVSPINYSIPFSNYALKLFREVYSGEVNEMISPLSVSYALGMIANGAEGNTLTQIEKLLGMNKDEFNAFLKSYMDSLPNGDSFKFSVANSLWIRNSFAGTVSYKYLSDLLGYYNAEVYTSPFDNSTVNDINKWVSNKTDNMIDKVIENVSNSQLVMVNALCFDAEWDENFFAFNTLESFFTKSNGEQVTTDFMRGTLSSYYNKKNYIEDDNCTGIIKYYKDNKYAFIAIMPNEGVTLNDYVSVLDGEKLNSLILHASCEEVKILLPRFETTFEGSLKDHLKSLGMTDAFNLNTSEFSGISNTTPLYISDVIHKTYIKVYEEGTKASATTTIPVPGDTVGSNTKYVYLNRPFVYMIIDCENSIPMFIGSYTVPSR